MVRPGRTDETNSGCGGRTGEAQRKHARERQTGDELNRKGEVGPAQTGRTGDALGEALEKAGGRTAECEVREEWERTGVFAVGGGESGGVEEGAADDGFTGDGVVEGGGTGVVGAGRGGRTVAVSARVEAEKGAERGVAGDVVVGRGDIVFLAVDPWKWATQIEKELGGFKGGFEVEGETVLVSPKVLGDGGENRERQRRRNR